MATQAKNSFNLSLTIAAGLATIVAALTVGMGQAAANPTNVTLNFNFASLDGQQLSGSGVLQAISNGDGSFTAISGTGTETLNNVTEALTLVANPLLNAVDFQTQGQLNSFSTADNLVYPSANPTITNNGLLFSFPVNVAAATFANVNLYSNGPGSFSYSDSNNINDNISFRVSPVPEPTTVLMFALGLGFLGFMRGRVAKR